MTPWTVAPQAPLSMEFFRQEFCSGLPFPSPRDLPDPGIEPGFPAEQADSLPAEPPGKPTEDENQGSNMSSSSNQMYAKPVQFMNFFSHSKNKGCLPHGMLAWSEL